MHQFTKMLARFVKLSAQINVYRSVTKLHPVSTVSVLNNTHQRRDYKNFGHKPEPVPKITRYWYTFLLLGFILPTINYKWYVFIY